jgi:YegS/Rv2252/BmrU family lipid kinase
MNQDRWFIVLNPKAGGGKGQRSKPKLIQAFHNCSINYFLYETNCAGDAIQVVKQAITDGYRKFCVAGGDGTLNEVATGILGQTSVNSTEMSIGVIPVGTGNDWRRTYGISNDVDAAVATISKGKTQLQDAGKIEYHKNEETRYSWFVNIAGCGFDAQVTFAANRAKENGHSGVLTYIGKLISTLYVYKEPEVKIWLDDRAFEVELFSILAGICKFAGNNMKLVPDAIPNDGLFDITLASKISKLKVIANLPKLFNGDFVKLKEVQQFRCSKVRIESHPTIHLQADGESICETPIQFEIIPNAIRIVVP